jgi:hypothetical protein
LLLVIFAGWVSRRQLDVIEHLLEENRAVKELSSAKLSERTLAPRNTPKHRILRFSPPSDDDLSRGEAADFASV